MWFVVWANKTSFGSILGAKQWRMQGQMKLYSAIAEAYAQPSLRGITPVAGTYKRILRSFSEFILVILSGIRRLGAALPPGLGDGDHGCQFVHIGQCSDVAGHVDGVALCADGTEDSVADGVVRLSR